MNKVKAYIEIGKDGTYGVYPDLNDGRLNYGLLGEGASVNEAVNDFKVSYEEMKTFHKEIGKPFVEAEFEYCYDLPSFMNYYTAYFSVAGLSRLTGINKNQLSQYVNGYRHPSPKTIEKIGAAVNAFAKNLSQVRLVP